MIRPIPPARRLNCASAARPWLAPLLVLLSVMAARGAEAPTDISREQCAALVTNVANTLTKGAAVKVDAPTGEPKPLEDEIDQVAQTVEDLIERSPAIVATLPSLPGRTVEMLSHLDRGSEGGRHEGAYTRVLLACFLGLLALDAALGFVLRSRLRRLESQSGPASLKRVASAAALELLRPLAVWLASRICIGALFGSAGFQTTFATAVLYSTVTVIAIRCLLEIWLRPTWPSGRLMPLDDSQAARFKRGLTAVVVLPIMGQVWATLLNDEASVSAALLVDAVAVPAAYTWVAWRLRDVFAAWLGRLVFSGPDAPKRGRHIWTLLACVLLPLTLILRLYSALADAPEVPEATMTTLGALMLLLFGETLIQWILGHPEAAAARSDVEARILRSGARLARVLMLLLAAGYVARTWLVDALEIVPEGEWSTASRHWWIAGMATLLAFAAWEFVRFATDPYLAKSAAPAAGSAAAADSSRARTLAPLVRSALFVAITTLGALTVLSILGVNITPLVAGASIVGLAISFGSQTLVRDIVSGVFYLAEDAFRVGEYIDCGKAKGTVEGFALRSLRLRHQNGQLHTIPFGQLGQVTNFSRDWSTVKFTLRFARDTDLDALRKAAKKVGQSLMDDPEFADAIIDPLKMQGVAEILDDALVVRFKFTVKPERPSEIQRESIRRLLRDLPMAGIKFAQAAPTYIQLSPLSGEAGPQPATSSTPAGASA